MIKWDFSQTAQLIKDLLESEDARNPITREWVKERILLRVPTHCGEHLEQLPDEPDGVWGSLLDSMAMLAVECAAMGYAQGVKEKE